MILKLAKCDWLIALPSFLFGVRNKPVEKGITALKEQTGLDAPIPISIVNKQLEKMSLEYSGQLPRHLDCSVFTSERKTKSNSKDNILFWKNLWMFSCLADCWPCKTTLRVSYSGGPHEVLSLNHELNTVQKSMNGLSQIVCTTKNVQTALSQKRAINWKTMQKGAKLETLVK